MASVTAGTVIAGKYRLDEPIGQGGMASIWRATHLTLDSPVAVKLLDVAGAKADRLRERFEREAKLAAAIKHRNVVDILDFGVHEERYPYMVMELLAGESLGDRLEGDTPITDAELFDVAAQVLSGLAAAHDAGVVHRDVKPDNVFLVRDADGVYPKLLDFGISRDLNPGKNDTRVTSTGVLVGTPLYMSPEQARGLRDVDARTDLWSVGAMLYEALTGHLPFDSENMGDILIRIAMEDMPPVKSARPDLPDEAAGVVMKALARDREKRWQSAREMREALLRAREALVGQAVRLYDRSSDSILAPRRRHEGLHDEDTSSGPLMRAPRERARWPLAIGVGVAAFAAVAGIAFIAFGGEVRFSEDEPERPLVEVAAEPAPAPAAPEVEPPPVEAPRPVEPTVAVAPEAVVPEPVPEAVVPEPVAEAPGRRRSQPAQPDPPPTAGAPETATEDPEGTGFLRDLDY